MGLGLFIAKTLLERTGARLKFTNASEEDTQSGQSGAVVELRWPAERLVAPESGPLGENTRITS